MNASAPPQPKLTPEQTAALAAHDRSVSLAAGAGCGKTFVLTERFLSYLDPSAVEQIAQLHELVAITFTDAAAREMRTRLRKRCFERLARATDPVEQQAWRRLMRSLDAARISTIHSFCAGLLRTHAVEAELDPQFEQLDQASADLLRLRTLDDRLRQLLLERNEVVIQLATRFGLATLREHLAMLLGENLAPVIAAWRDATTNDLIGVWKQHFAERTATQAAADFLASEAAQTVTRICNTAKAAAPELSALFDRLQQIFAGLKSTNQAAPLLRELRELAKVQSGPARKKNWADQADYVAFKDACEVLRKSIDGSIICRPWSEEHLQETARTGLDLLALAADVAACYQAAKQQRSVLEFDDLIQKSHQLLTEARFAQIQQELAGTTRLLLVDEFQDTDPIQVEIVKAFCGDTWQQQGLFVVGDFKQSIYRFRGAEPAVSQQFREELPLSGRLSLTTNFRSQGAILNFVNALFCDSFEKHFEPLRPMREQLTPLPCIEFLWAPESVQGDDTIPPQLRGVQRQRYLEARFIAKRVAQLIDSREPLIVENESLRPVQPGDVAILLRSLSDVQVYEAALREQSLEYYLAGGHAFYAQQEIHDVLHLLRAVVSVADDLSLAGALRSPLFALTDETLFWLVNHAGSINGALVAESLPEELIDEERSKVIRAGNILNQLRKAKDSLPVAELLNQAIELTGYDAVLLAEFLGKRKLANLHKLVEQARTLDRLNPGDVSGFVTQLSEFVARAPKEPVATTSASGDVVSIMTIHNAKGLEFPLVVVPDLDRKPPPANNKPVMNRKLGPLVPAKSEDKVCVGWDLHQFDEKQEEFNEKLRLLYVACTRAADYLILSSSLKDPHKPASDWLRFLDERFDLTTGECRAALPAGYDVPEIRVITSEPDSHRQPAGRTRSVDLTKLIEKTQALAEAGQGVIPTGVAPIPPHSHARRRFSFSRLSGELLSTQAHSEIADDTSAPATLDPLGFGTLVHELLELALPLGSQADVRELCKILAPQHLGEPSPETIEEASVLVVRFLSGERGRQITQSRHIRELEFLLPWPCPGDDSAGRYLHGFMDCLYQDAHGDWHLLDYKSNQVTAAGVPAAAQGYEMQMFVYALACERALGKRPVECTVCFLRPDREYSFTWTPEQRIPLAAKLDQAIAGILSGRPTVQKS